MAININKHSTRKSRHWRVYEEQTTGACSTLHYWVLWSAECKLPYIAPIGLTWNMKWVYRNTSGPITVQKTALPCGILETTYLALGGAPLHWVKWNTAWRLPSLHWVERNTAWRLPPTPLHWVERNLETASLALYEDCLPCTGRSGILETASLCSGWSGILKTAALGGAEYWRLLPCTGWSGYCGLPYLAPNGWSGIL